MDQSFQIRSGSSEEARAIQCRYREAQRWCNFTLLKPAWFPADLTDIEQSLRSEQASHSSSYRIVAKGAQRCLSLKQFLFDFAPPAYDHPNLWRNPKTTTAGEFPAPRAYLLNDNVVWIGHDHRKLPAATVGLHRVRVELTVLAGRFSDQELLAICQGLTAADPAYARHLQEIPFAALSYQARCPQTATDVPLSYWRYKRHAGDRHLAMPIPDDAQHGLDIEPPDLSSLGYSLDSLFLISQEDNRASEVDFVYEAKERNGAYLRLLVSPPTSPRPLPFPPEADTQACKTRRFTIEGHDVCQAWHTDAYGAYEACFRYSGNNAMLLAQPARWTNQAWFLQLLASMLSAA